MDIWKKIKRKSKPLFHWDGNLSMEVYVFNGLLVIVVISILLFAVINLLIGNLSLVWVSLITALFLAVCFYFLRVKNDFRTAVLIVSISCYPLLAFGFFNNDGIDGSIFYAFLLVHLILLIILNGKVNYLWTFINMSFFLGLYYIGLYHEEWVEINYSSKEEIFLDHSITYLMALIGISLAINSIKRFYSIKKNKVKQQTTALIKVNKSLSQTSEKKDKIITIISHDLKNPLQSIMQTLELINSGDLSEEEAKFLREELLKTTKRTYQMMENILEWSSFEIKNVAGREKMILVKDLFEDTMEILKVIAKQKSILLQVHYHKNPMVDIETDRLLLIFRNLIQNAIKFTPIGGYVTVNINCKDEQLILEIEDTGIGISPDRLKNMFEQDIKPTYGTEQEKGTGMGLHLCFQSAHKLSGQLNVESTEGEGSIFKLVIPTGINKNILKT